MRLTWFLLVVPLFVGCTQGVDDADGDGHTLDDGDCNDADARVFFGQPELCNGFDDDCDVRIDEGFDLDRDGWLDGNAPGCGESYGASVDCDDADAAVHPGAAEVCDGRDEDCTGVADEAWDEDGDLHAPCAGDCDDLDPLAHVDADEICDGVDNDCDSEIDTGFDDDGDGVTICRGDCDDDDPDLHPLVVETCDGEDENCDGVVDDGFDADLDGASTCAEPLDCDDLDDRLAPGLTETCDGLDNDCNGAIPTVEADGDGDGAMPCAGDCDDSDPLRGAHLSESCDGFDNDCDPATLEAVDADGDARSVCDGDCDDTRAEAFPGATETCNGLDEDCDGFADEGDPACAGCEGLTHEGVDYLFCTTYTPWEQAADLCEGLGQSLATIESLAESGWLWDRAAERVWDAWWVGYSDRVAEGLWMWESGATADFTLWEAGQPDNWGNEDCAHLWVAPTWNDAPCEWAYPFVCEAPAAP